MEKKKLLLSIMVVGMFSSAALAIAPMGPPVAGLAEGQYAVGLGFAIADQTLEVSGPVTPVGDAEIDVESNIYYGCLGYGISDTWSVAVALGMADAAFDADGSGSDFDGDSEFAFAVQTKRTLHDNGSDTKWGTIFQYCRGSSEDKTSKSTTYGKQATSTISANKKVELEWYEMQLALGPAVQLNEDICVYGGPFLHFVEGDLTAQGSQYEYELEQRIELGGFIGALINLGSNASLSLEFLFTGEAWGAGIGAMFPL